MPTLKLPRELAQELASITTPGTEYMDHYPECFAEFDVTELVENRPTGDTTRWTSIHELVIRTKDGALWRATYEEGLTERQDTWAFDDAGDLIDFKQVRPVVVSSIGYEPVADES